MNVQSQQLSYSTPSSAYQETGIEMGADHPSSPMASAAPHAIEEEHNFADGHPLDNTGITDADLSEPGTPSAKSTPSINAAPIGTVAEYDPFWTRRKNVDPAMVERFRSSMKFDTLITSGVIRTGDVLTFQVSALINGQTQDTEAHLQIIGRSRDPVTRHHWPELSVTLRGDPNTAYPTAKACRGTSTMIKHLDECNITVKKQSWRDIEVLRGQEALGNLWRVKQAFHLWRDLKDQEAHETGQHFRQRRAQGKGMEGAKQFNGIFGVWRNGVFVADKDQARYRCKG